VAVPITHHHTMMAASIQPLPSGPWRQGKGEKQIDRQTDRHTFDPDLREAEDEVGMCAINITYRDSKRQRNNGQVGWNALLNIYEAIHSIPIHGTEFAAPAANLDSIHFAVGLKSSMTCVDVAHGDQTTTTTTTTTITTTNK